MRKRALAAALLLAMLLSLAACGGGTGEETKDPTGTASQPAQGSEEETPRQTEGTGGEDSQPTEEPGEETAQPSEAPGEAETRYIFSDRPVAAYEVTGLDLKNVPNEAAAADGSYPHAKLTPGENSFIIFCIPVENNPDYPKSAATVRSPAGNSQWEGWAYSWYSTFDYELVPEGEARLEKEVGYLHQEAADGAHYYSTLWVDWIMFTALHHPDTAWDDLICVIDVTTYEEELTTVDECLETLVNCFVNLGASVKEIPVDEALARCRVEVS